MNGDRQDRRQWTPHGWIEWTAPDWRDRLDTQPLLSPAEQLAASLRYAAASLRYADKDPRT